MQRRRVYNLGDLIRSAAAYLTRFSVISESRLALARAGLALSLYPSDVPLSEYSDFRFAVCGKLNTFSPPHHTVYWLGPYCA